MPVALTIQAGGVTSSFTFGVGWGLSRLQAARTAPSPRMDARARVIDVKPAAAPPSRPAVVGQKKVIGYLAPARTGEAPRLLYDSIPLGQHMDIAI